MKWERDEREAMKREVMKREEMKREEMKREAMKRDECDCDWVGFRSGFLFLFISTIMSYLMPNPFLLKNSSGTI